MFLVGGDVNNSTWKLWKAYLGTANQRLREGSHLSVLG